MKKKYLFITFFLVSAILVKSQQDIIGTYHQKDEQREIHFYNILSLNQDGEITYTFRHDLFGEKIIDSVKGKWEVNDDTLLLFHFKTSEFFELTEQKYDSTKCSKQILFVDDKNPVSFMTVELQKGRKKIRTDINGILSLNNDVKTIEVLTYGRQTITLNEEFNSYKFTFIGLDGTYYYPPTKFLIRKNKLYIITGKDIETRFSFVKI